MYWSKVFVSQDKYPCHPARPLVSVVAVNSFGDRKTFHHASAILIHLPAHKCSSSNEEGAGQLHIHNGCTRLMSKKTLISTALSSNFFASSQLPKGGSTSWYSSTNKSYLNSGFIMLPPCQKLRHTQALHTYRINLSPFTKDFRVWGASMRYT